MNTLRIHLSEEKRTCAVDGEALTEWSRKLIDDVLFEAARDMPDRPGDTPIETSVTFRIALDGDGSVLIEQRGKI